MLLSHSRKCRQILEGIRRPGRASLRPGERRFRGTKVCRVLSAAGLVRRLREKRIT